MVFMLCLTGKAQRFANCKICASPCACCHSVCTLKKKNNKLFHYLARKVGERVMAAIPS